MDHSLEQEQIHRQEQGSGIQWVSHQSHHQCRFQFQACGGPRGR